jgi:acyl-homoserine-lactone acylase
MGHNGRVAWANTVNAPDLSDLYEVRLLPAGDPNPAAYEYDGARRPLVRREFTFRVRQSDGTLAERRQTVLYTHHGPLVPGPPPGGTFYAVRKSGVGNVGLFDQVRAQCLAGDVAAYRQALAPRSVVLFNHLFGDASGRIGYVSAGRVPRRPAGYDFRAPVPGWTLATEWGEPVPLAELPQAFDPDAGFFQNGNDAPFYAAPGIKLAPSARASDYPVWLAPDLRTLRGERMTRLLAERERVSPEDARAIATDTRDLQAERELPALLAAARSAGSAAAETLPAAEREALAEAARTLAAWDGRLLAGARGPALFAAWLAQPAVAPLLRSWRFPETFGAEPVADRDPSGAVRALVAAARSLRSQALAVDAAWGEVHRHRRGGVDLPLDGGGDSLCPTTTAPPDAAGKRAAVFGSSFRMVVELGNGPARAWSVAPYGNSDQPASPHFTDQMPLYAARKFRRVPFTRAEVEKEATARTTLRYPPPPPASG